MNHRSRLLVLSLIGLTGCSLATNFEQFRAPDDAGNDIQDAGDGDAGGDGDGDGDAGGTGMDAGPTQEGQIDVALGDDALGSVTSDPEGIDCGETCSAVFPEGTEVVLTAHPHPTAAFAGWGGACADEPSTTCVLTAGEPLAVSASFTLDWFDVTVSRLGAGSVSSSDGMLRCDGSSDEVCSVRYPRGATVTLSASPSAGSTFSGWSGACAGTGSCALEITGSKLVNAVFDSEGQVSLLVSKLGNGAGTVKSGDTPASIECGAKCAASFDPSKKTEVVLHATPDGSSDFKGFEGDCTPVVGEPTQCAVTMDAVKRVSAKFELKQHALTVAWNGQGEGSVVAESPAGLECEKPENCEASYQHGTVVRLKAVPAQGSSFREWSIASCGSEEVCEITLLGETLVVATFDVSSFALTTGVLGNGQLLCNDGPCEDSYVFGTEITLSALPGSGHELKSWQQACAGTPVTEDCVITISGDTQVVAQFGPKSYQITVEVVGNGSVSGDVACDEASSPCTGSVSHGGALELIATAGQNHDFVGWTGGGCGGDTTCSVDPVTGDLSLKATFVQPVPDTTTVSLSKTGKGSVTASPGPLACGEGCSGANAQYPEGTTVTLTATPASGYGQAVFSGVDCGNPPPPANTCIFTTDGSVQNVSVTFPPAPQGVQVTRAGAGAGTVKSEPAGIDCGAVCSSDFPFDSVVKLTATPMADSVFTGWSGRCTGAAPTCEFTVGLDNEVTATFALKNYTLTVELEGDGVGGVEPLITGNGVSCVRNGTSGCKASLPAGTLVRLRDSAPPWAKFIGFSSNDFELKGDTTVRATFAAVGALAFVTSVEVNGGFASHSNQGAAAGDELCAQLAQAKGVELPGPWVAWLSDGNSHPRPAKNVPGRLRNLTPETPIVRVDGEYVLKGGLAQVEREDLDNPISIDQRGDRVGDNVAVWTATLPTGLVIRDDDPFCSNWRSTSGSIPYGVGNAISVDAKRWTYEPDGIRGSKFPLDPGAACSLSAHLYCFRDIAVSP